MIIFSLLVIFACNNGDDGDNDLCSGLWSNEVADELQLVSERANIYAQDPSSLEKCNSLKDAYEDYIAALERFDNCSGWTAQDRANWESALDDAKESVASMCDDL